jgi:hypothetical protein
MDGEVSTGSNVMESAAAASTAALYVAMTLEHVIGEDR